MTTIIYKISKLLLALTVAILVLLFLYSTVSSQESRLQLNMEKQKLSANIKNTPLKDVIKEIKDEKHIWFDTGFMRDKSLLDNDISVNFWNVSIQEGLDRILSGINYSLFFNGNTIVGVMLLGTPDKRYYRGRNTTRRMPVRRSSSREVRRRP